jgi:hypothetical protein
MIRAARWAALAALLAACATGDRGAVVARYAGTWDGRSFTAGIDTGYTWRSYLSVAQDGALIGSLTYADRSRSIPLTTIEATDSLLVQQLGPYRSQALKTRVIATFTGRLVGDSLRGEYVVRPMRGGQHYGGHFVAVRRPPAAPGP